jgi:DNA invertase Pin-like site-specific DNA recombinase
MEQARLTGATLLIAKLDRLSRDAHFLLGLQKAGVKFVAADMPEANELVVGLMALIAQAERQMIRRARRPRSRPPRRAASSWAIREAQRICADSAVARGWRR